MFKMHRLLLLTALLLPYAPAFALDLEESMLTRESLVDIQGDEGVTDPRGDESPNPREDDLVCDNVVCGDEGPSCTTCGKPAQ